MEPTQSPLETEVHSGEVSKPTGDLSLSDSIVNAEIKEDLLDDAVVDEAHKDSDSVVSARDAAGGDGDGNGGGECSSAKVELPEELAKGVVILTCDSTVESGSCDVYLIGTSHVSKKSCQEVQAIISFLKPEVVFLELCSSRESMLQPQTMKVPTLSDMIESWKQKQNTFGIIYSWFLAKIASELEVLPGSEFRAAYDEALKCGAEVLLFDRPVQITLKRTWAKMPLWHKVKFLYALVFQPVSSPSSEKHDSMPQETDTADTITQLIEEMSEDFPSLMETLVHERDQFMATVLLDVASEYNLVVAVVGRGHINGIKKNWKKPVKLEDLTKIPSDDSVFTVKRIVSAVAIAVAGTGIVTGILLSRRR